MSLFNRCNFLRVLFFLLLFFCYICNYAQNNVDSVKALLKTNVHDTVKLKSLSELMPNISESDPDYFLLNDQVKLLAEKHLADKSLTAGNRKMYQRFLAGYYDNLTVNPRNSDFYASLGYCEKAIELYQQAGDENNLAYSLINKGICYEKIYMYDRAIKTYFEGLKSFEKQKDEEGITYSIQAIANLYFYQKNYPEAIIYFNKALSFYENLKDSSRYYTAQKAIVYHNLGSVFLNTEKYPEASIHFTKALELSKSAGDEYTYCMTLTKLGDLNHAQHNDDKAISCYSEAMQLASTDPMKAEIENNLGDIFLSKKQYAKATEQYNSALVNAKSGHSLIHIMASSKSLYEVYKMMGNYGKSLEMHELYTQIKDSAKLEESKNTLKEQKLTYEFEKKELLTRASQEKKLADMRIANEKKMAKRNMLLYTLISIAVLLIAGIVFLTKYFRQKTLIEGNKNNELKQKLLLTQMNPHFIFNSIDNIQGLIYNKQDDTAINYLSKFSKLTRQILENSRENYITLGEELEMLDNYLSIQQLLYNNNFSYRMDVEPGIDKELLMLPPMLTQPFIENAVKHGLKNKQEGGVIHIVFYMRNEQLFFEVTDNGSGIAEKVTAGKKSLSTQITKERLDSIAAKKNIVIETANITGTDNVTKGVRTIFEIPYIHNN